MCEPTTLLMMSLAISAASAGMSYVQGEKNADTQTENLQRAQDQQIGQLNLQQHQADQQAGEQMSDRALEALKETGRLTTIAGESGGGGASNGRIVNEAGFNATHDIATIEANRLNGGAQRNMDAQGVRSSTQSALNSIQRPSLIGTGLQIGGAAVGAYSGYRSGTFGKLPSTTKTG